LERNLAWVKTGNLTKNIITEADIDERITELALKKTSLKKIPRGTILMAMYGQGKTRGQVSILGVDATINQACAAILLKDGVSRDYIFQQLKYRYNEIRSISNAEVNKIFSADLIRSIRIPLYSLSVQKLDIKGLAILGCCH